jgi:hypothetical protein
MMVLRGDESQEMAQDQIVYRFLCPVCGTDYRFRLSTLLEVVLAASIVASRTRQISRPRTRSYFVLLSQGKLIEGFGADLDLSQSQRLLAWNRRQPE